MVCANWYQKVDESPIAEKWESGVGGVWLG